MGTQPSMADGFKSSQTVRSLYLWPGNLARALQECWLRQHGSAMHTGALFSSVGAARRAEKSGCGTANRAAASSNHVPSRFHVLELSGVQQAAG